MKSTEFIAEGWEDDFGAELDADANKAKQQTIDASGKFDMPEDLIRKLDTIKDNCKPYLQEVNYSPIHEFPMYRGIGSDDTFFELPVQLKVRAPKDTSPKFHKFINNYFTEHFGAPFRNAMFCTGSQSQALQYGRLYYIFPVGHFEYLWSHTIEDLFTGLDMNGIKDTFALEEFLDQGNYKKSVDLKKAIVSGNEIMIRCRSYIALSKGNTSQYEKQMEEYFRS